MNARARHLGKKPRVLERALFVLLSGSALLVAGLYLTSLLHLLWKGGAKVLTFTLYASPLEDVDGEVIIRRLLAGVVGLFVGWIASSIARRAWPLREGDTGATLWIKKHERGLALVAFGILGSLTLQNHLPHFLISLPSETTKGGGVGPEIFNTIYFAVLSTAVTLPIGVGAAVFLARFARNKPFVASVRIALDTLASLPSIVYGLFGFLVFVVQMGAGYSLLAGAFVLALLNLPLVVGIAEESLRSVPRELEDASLALGATRVQTVFRVTLPYAWPGILSAAMLSIGRVFAESAPLIMTAGTTISRASAYSLNPMRGGETLAVHLWYVNSNGLGPDSAEVSAGTAAVLVVLVALTNVAAARLAKLGGAEGRRTRRILRTT